MEQLTFDLAAGNSGPVLCSCGCGAPTPLAEYSDKRKGLIKGQPRPYIKGHNRHWRIDEDGRQCIRCDVYKPWSEFYPLTQAGVRGHQGDCKECHKEGVRTTRDPVKRKENARRWREANPDKYAIGQIVQAAKSRGLDPALVVAHFRAHHGACDICGRPPSAGDRRTSRLCIDHDHHTGEFRGLLCASCNTGIGKFRDDPAILAAAIDYLNRAKGAACQSLAS